MRTAFLLTSLFISTALFAQSPTPSATGLDGVHDMKVAFDVVDGNPKVLMAKLANIDTTRKQLIEAGVTPHMVLTFRKINKADVMPEVKVVPNGWIALAAYQQKGFKLMLGVSLETSCARAWAVGAAAVRPTWPWPKAK